jgi:DNA repair protein RecO (recombination protein O)
VAPIVTDAIVLHAFDYRETSRILRLATRDAGVRSVIARGARRSKNRFGPALDLFAEGSATITLSSHSDLHTLSSFDVIRARESLAAEWGRFAAASALSEIVLRFAHGDANPALFESFAHVLDSLATAPPGGASSVALGGAWRIVADLGFAPVLDSCASCGAPLPTDQPARFAHRAGGALCARCSRDAPGSRDLPAPARSTLASWLSGDDVTIPDDRDVRAHQRLLRQFLVEHLAEERPLRAFAVWEADNWNGS